MVWAGSEWAGEPVKTTRAPTHLLLRNKEKEPRGGEEQRPTRKRKAVPELSADR